MPKTFELNRDLAQFSGGLFVFVVAALLGKIFSAYLISLLTIVLLFAFIGQSWSLMLGLGGQLVGQTVNDLPIEPEEATGA